MKTRGAVLCAVAAVGLCVSVAAQMQQGATGFHTVACFKIKPDKGLEFRAWAASDLHKYVQSRVNAGVLEQWILLRSVMPQGTSATCDYLSISIYPGAPPEPLGPEGIGEALKKAGMNMTAQQYIERRDSMTTLVSNNLFRNRASVGTLKTGNYLQVSYMKSANTEDWVALEKKIWQPFAEAMVKDGVQSGWSVNVQVLPNGTDLPFQGVTVDVFPTWDAVFKQDAQFIDRFRKVHPDMEFGTTIEQFEKLRTQEAVHLFTAVDVINPAK